jgi:hypothetical protein
MHQNSTSLASFGRQEAHLFSCKIWGELCNLFIKKSHDQQQVTLLMGNEPILFFFFFFKKRRLKNLAAFWFLNWRKPGTLGTHVYRVQNVK